VSVKSLCTEGDEIFKLNWGLAEKGIQFLKTGKVGGVKRQCMPNNRSVGVGKGEDSNSGKKILLVKKTGVGGGVPQSKAGNILGKPVI